MSRTSRSASACRRRDQRDVASTTAACRPSLTSAATGEGQVGEIGVAERRRGVSRRRRRAGPRDAATGAEPEEARRATRWLRSNPAASSWGGQRPTARRGHGPAGGESSGEEIVPVEDVRTPMRPERVQRVGDGSGAFPTARRRRHLFRPRPRLCPQRDLLREPRSSSPGGPGTRFARGESTHSDEDAATSPRPGASLDRQHDYRRAGSRPRRDREAVHVGAAAMGPETARRRCRPNRLGARPTQRRVAGGRGHADRVPRRRRRSRRCRDPCLRPRWRARCHGRRSRGAGRCVRLRGALACRSFPGSTLPDPEDVAPPRS